MRFSEILRGTWFLPNSENKVKGRLYSNKGKIYLEVFSPLKKSQPLSFESHEIIHGITYDQKELTLYQCSESLSSHYDEDNSVSIYLIRFVINNGHFTKNTFLFDRAEVNLSGLEEWLGVKFFERNAINNEVIIKHSETEAIEEIINENLKIKVSFSRNMHTSKRNKMELSTSASICLSSKDKITFDSWFKIVTHLSTFLSLSYTKYCSIITLSFSNADVIKKYSLYIEGKDFSHEEVLEHSIKGSVSKKAEKNAESIHFHKMIFLYSDIKENISYILRKWYEIEDKLRPILNLLLENIFNDSPFNENNFLNSIHGVETFHRRFRNNVLLPVDEHNQRVIEIISSVDEKHKDWIKPRIEYGNEPSLHIRLEEVMQEVGGVFFNEVIKEKSKFITQIKNSRNYYTHYDLRLQKKALKTSDLFYLTRKLDYILLFLILKEIGFDSNVLNTLLLKQLRMGLLFDRYSF